MRDPDRLRFWEDKELCGKRFVYFQERSRPADSQPRESKRPTLKDLGDE